jgi:gag-polypeptide of LTR copia-type
MSDEFKIRITKLAADGTNWVTYRNWMMWALDTKGLLEHLTSDMITSDYSAAGTIDGLTPEVRWERDEAMVKQFVASSVPDRVFSQIKAGLTAKEFWDQLGALYEGRSKLILFKLRKRLQNTRCGADDDVRAHFDKLADLKEQLAAMGDTITDEEYGNILLESLPDSYDNTRIAITTAAELSGKTITPTLVIRVVTGQYDRRTLKKGKAKSSKDEALYTNGQRKGQRNVECFNCRRKGHVKAGCWAKGGGKEGRGPHGSRIAEL